MKIIIIGYSGAGKTFLSENVAKKLKCPVMHIDDLLFTNDFDLKDSETAVKFVEKILCENTSWIMDGYKDTFTKHEWLEAADYIVFLDFNRIICFLHVLKRTCRRAVRGADTSLAHNSAPALDLETTSEKPVNRKPKGKKNVGGIWQFSKIFRSFRWILLDERRLGNGKYYFNAGKMFPDKFVVLKNQKEWNRFINEAFRHKKILKNH